MSGNGSWLTVPLRERDGQGRKGRRGAGWRALQANRPAESGTGFFGTKAEPGGEASDDRQTEQAPVVDPAMPAAGAQSLVAVLSAGNRQHGRPGADGADRSWRRRITVRARLAASRGPCRQPQAGLMRQMGLQVIWQKPNTSKPNPEHKVYPYLLRGLTIDRPNQVWATDITYIPMPKGFFYLVA